MNLTNSNILVLSIAKNIAPNPLLVQSKIGYVLNLLQKYSNSFHFFFYENDSSDYTRMVLKKFSQDTHFTVQSENLELDNKLISIGRIEKISEARNKTLEFAFEHQNEYDYVLIIDFDLYQLNINCLFNQIDIIDWDVLTANGKTRDGNLYYDWWALQLIGEFASRYHCLFPYSRILHYLNKCPELFNLDINDDPIPVWSAFGGCAIYKMKSLIQCIDGYYEIFHQSEHVSLNKQIIKNNGKIWIYPKLVTRWHDNIPFPEQCKKY